MSGVTVATTIRSIEDASTPASASAATAAGSAMSVSACSLVANRRSRIPVRSTIHSSVVSTNCSRSLFVKTRSGTQTPRPVIPMRAPLAEPITTTGPRRTSACRARRALRRRSRAPCRARSGRAPSSRSHSSVSRSPGRTTRLKRTPSMPAKSAIRPRFSSRLSTATAPAWASASTIFTPGMIGLPGKWPAQSSSVTSLRATTRTFGSSSITSSSRRNGSRCGRIASISAFPSGRFMPTAAPGARCGHGARSTWPYPTGIPSEPAISSKLKSNASLSTTTLACAGAIWARHAPSSARSSDTSAARAGSPSRASRRSSSSGSQRRASCRCATSRHAFTVRRCSQVENDDSPRNWGSFTHSFASASWAASRASSWSRSRCCASRCTSGRVPFAQRVERARVAVLCSLHQDRVTQPLVDERRIGPQVLPDWTRSKARRLHPPSLRPGEVVSAWRPGCWSSRPRPTPPRARCRAWARSGRVPRRRRAPRAPGCACRSGASGARAR